MSVSQRNARVLLVDDDPDVRRDYAKISEFWSFARGSKPSPSALS